jgi:cation transport ATPase
MNDQLDHLKKIWQNSRSNDFGKSADTDRIIEMAKQKMRSTIRMQLGTILILMITLVIITAYFFYVAKFNQTISHIGALLMIAGLALRIIIELISIYLSTTINMSDTTLKTNKAALDYYRFRERINGPVTIAIIIIYSLGFYMLTPEFSLYFRTPVLIMIDVSYIFIAAIFIWIVRRTIKKEMNILNEIIVIQNDITEDGNK